MDPTQTNRINDVVRKLYPKDFQSAKARWKKFSFNFDDNKAVILTISCFLLLLTLFSVYFYNRFVSFKTDALTAEAQVRAYLQKRGNIVTNLTKMVVDYAEHERTMYRYTADVRKELVTQTDMLLSAAQSIDRTQINDKEFQKFESLLSKFMAWSESYPDLKLNMNFQDFMREIVAVETNIADARVVYNAKVNAYTTYIMKFPNNIYAELFRFGPMEFYTGNAESQKFKEVDF